MLWNEPRGALQKFECAVLQAAQQERSKTQNKEGVV